MSKVTSPEKFLTPPKIASLLRVAHSKVLAWIASGELRAADLSMIRGRRPRWYIAKTDLEAFLDRRKNDASEIGAALRPQRFKSDGKYF